MKKLLYLKNTKKKFYKTLGIQYLVLSFFWLIFISFLLAVLILFIKERNSVNAKNNVNEILDKIAASTNAAEKLPYYQQLMNIKYPLIDFSLMSFVMFTSNQLPITDPAAAWNQRLSNINIAYSYIFITLLIAIIAFIFYIILIIKINFRDRFEKRYKLETNFSNEYAVYDIKMYLTFLTSLALVFSFFNFLSTLVTLVYGTILVLTSYFFWYVLKIKNETLVKHKWWKSPNFILLGSIFVIQNGYNILKIFFTDYFSVNLDLILTILFPIGTITVMITLLIRNILNTKVSAVVKAIKSIKTKVSAFRIFYYTQKDKSLEDYTFVAQLPTLIRVPLENNKINAHEAYELMTVINDATIFFEQHFIKPKELNYMLFHLFNEIKDVNEINEIKNNVLKIQSVVTKKQENKEKNNKRNN